MARVKNVGPVDRMLRFAAAGALLSLLTLDTDWRWLGLLAILPIATASFVY